MYLTIYIGDILSIKTGVIHQNKKLEKKFTGKQNKSFFPSKKQVASHSKQWANPSNLNAIPLQKPCRADSTISPIFFCRKTQSAHIPNYPTFAMSKETKGFDNESYEINNNK